MANLENVNITITATDDTGSGVESAVSNISKLSDGVTSFGDIAGGVFGGILGAQVFSTISSGIGDVISSAFSLNDSFSYTQAASQSMLDTISQTDPIATGAFGAASKAAESYGKTIRDLNEKQSDELDDYSTKIDDLKNKILDANKQEAASLQDALDKENSALSDANEAHKNKVDDLNASLADSTESHTDKLASIADTQAQKLSNLADQKAQKEDTINQQIAELQTRLAFATTGVAAQTIREQIALKQTDLQQTEDNYNKSVQAANDAATKQTAAENEAYAKKQAALQLQLDRENKAYAEKTAKVKANYDDEVQKAKDTDAAKLVSLNEEISKEEETHRRFLRDLQESYADAGAKLQEALSGGRGGSGAKKVKFQFDFDDAFRDLDPSKLNDFIDNTATKMKDMALNSPFDPQLISQAGQQLIRFTGGSLDNYTKLLGITEELAAKNPVAGIQGAQNALSTFFATGNAAGLTRQFKISSDELQNIAKNAKSPTDAIDLFQQAVSRAGGSMEGVNDLANSQAGAFQLAKNQIGGLVAEVSKPFYNTFKSDLIAVNKFLQSHKTQIDDVATALSGGFSTGLSTAATVVGGFVTALKSFWDQYGSQIMDWFNTMANTMIPIFVSELKLLKTIWADTIQPAIEKIIIPSLERIWSKIMELWTTIAPKLKAALDAIQQWWSENSNQIMGIIQIAWAVIEFVISRAIDTLKLVISVALDIISGNWKGVWDDIKQYVSDIWGDIEQLAKGLWDGVQSYFKDGINGIIDQINSFTSGINNAMKGKKVGPVSLEVNIPQIPKLAAGGIAMGPTLAMIGEAGPEAVVPLSGSAGQGLFGNDGGQGDVNIYVTGNQLLNSKSANDLADAIGRVFVQKLALQGRYLYK